MIASRALVHELRMFLEELREPRRVAVHDRLGGGLEVRDWRIMPLQGLHVRRELRPAREAVLARDEELRVGQQALRGAFARLPRLVPATREPIHFAAERARRDGVLAQLCQRFNPPHRPFANGGFGAGFAGMLQIFRELPVVIDAGAWRERYRVRHTNLLSLHAWMSAGVRLKEGSCPSVQL